MIIHKRFQNGFTLVELIVVIAIIGLLATIGVSSYSNVLKKGRDTKRIADLKEFVKAVKLYQIENGKAPGETYCDSSIGAQGTACPITVPKSGWDTTSAVWTELVGKGYLDKLPVDPINDSTYYYYYEPNNCVAPTPSLTCGGWVRAQLETDNSTDPHPENWSGP